MKLFTPQLVMTFSWVLWSAAALAQPPEPNPSYVEGLAPPDVLGYSAGCDADSCDGSCAAECDDGCRHGCRIGAKLLADIRQALQVLLTGHDRCCCSCDTSCCQESCDGDSAFGDPVTGATGIEIVPRSAWPPEYQDVPPPRSVTRSVMQLQRDTYARRATPGPTLAVDPGRRSSGHLAALELPEDQTTGTLVIDGQPLQGGFTAVATDLAD